MPLPYNIVDGVPVQMTQAQFDAFVLDQQTQTAIIDAARPLEIIKERIIRRNLKMDLANAFISLEWQQGNINKAAHDAWMNDMAVTGVTITSWLERRYRAGRDDIIHWLNGVNNPTYGDYTATANKFLGKTTTYASGTVQVATARRDRLIQILTD